MNRTLIIFFSVILMLGCLTQKPPGTKISASKYSPTAFVLHPKFKVFHENEESSKIYLKLLTNELRFSSANEERLSQSMLKINYKITNTLRGKDILDSSQTTVKINQVTNQTSVISFFKIKRFDLDQYFLEINIVDIYAGKKSQSFVTINNAKNDNSQYYLSFKNNNHKPVFEEYFNNSDTFQIMHTGNKDSLLYVTRYPVNFETAQAPYISEPETGYHFENDSAYLINFNNNFAIFSARKKGIYMLKTKPNASGGIMKVYFNKNFPLIIKSDELIKASKYLLTDEEYNQLIKSDNKKLALDNFWLSHTENKEKARELLKIWYNRATYANYYFTSYKEGYKTDRGMIYMVMGPPDDIQHFDDAEKWIYLNTKEETELEYIFVQQFNSFSENDFILIRETKYEPYYKKAIKSWRSGIVYDY